MRPAHSPPQFVPSGDVGVGEGLGGLVAGGRRVGRGDLARRPARLCRRLRSARTPSAAGRTGGHAGASAPAFDPCRSPDADGDVLGRVTSRGRATSLRRTRRSSRPGKSTRPVGNRPDPPVEPSHRTPRPPRASRCRNRNPVPPCRPAGKRGHDSCSGGKHHGDREPGRWGAGAPAPSANTGAGSGRRGRPVPARQQARRWSRAVTSRRPTVLASRPRTVAMPPAPPPAACR